MTTIAPPPSPRQRRLLEALARGPVSREDADRIAPASNGPHHIGTPRRGYRPTAADRRRIALILSTIGEEGAA